MQTDNGFFWTWFERHSDTFVELPGKTKKEFDYWVRLLQVMLAGCCHKQVYATIEWQTTDGVPRLIITANGNYHYFKMVEELVNEAPLSLAWEVMAFEPPRPIDFLIKQRFEDISFDPSLLYFLPLELYKDYEGYPPVLTVYADVDKPPGHRYKQAVECVLYNLLGEQSTILNISAVIVKPVWKLTTSQREEIFPIDCLPECIVDITPTNYIVNSNGKLKHKLD